MTWEEHQSYNSSTAPKIKALWWNALRDHALEKAFSYIVRKNGSVFEAIKGGTSASAGTLAFGGAGGYGSTTGADATDVIQAAQNATELTGGLCLLAPGIYTINDTLTLDALGTGWVGMGTDASVIKLVDSSGFAATKPLINVSNAAAKSFLIRDLCVDGNQAGTNTGGIGINVMSSTTTDAETVPTIDHVLVKNCYNDGISLGDGGFGVGIHIRNSSVWTCGGNGLDNLGSDCQISDSIFSQCQANGLHMYGGVSHVDNVKVFGNGRAGSYAGVWVNAASSHNIFTNVVADENYGAGWIIASDYNSFTGCGAYRNGWGENGSGFYLANADYNTFIGCQGINILTTGGLTPQLYGFQETGTSDYNKVLGCTFVANSSGQVAIAGANTQVHNTTGYVDWNAGASTGTGAPQTIAHGCSWNVTGADVILNDLEVGAEPYITSAPDATNIYVQAVAGQDYRWEVKRKP